MLLRLEACLVWPIRRRVERDGCELPLTAKEADVLKYLAAERRTVTADELMQQVWGWVGQSHTLATTIYTLRRKVEINPSKPTHLLTVRGEGYRFEPRQEHPWPTGLDGSHTLDAVIRSADVLQDLDFRAAETTLHTAALHPAAEGERSAQILMRLAHMAATRGELHQASQFLRRGREEAVLEVTRTNLDLVEARIAWRQGSDPRSALASAERRMGSQESVRFLHHFMAPPSATVLLSSAADPRASPNTLALRLLAAAHLVTGQERLEIATRALALAELAHSPHTTRLAFIGMAAGLAETGDSDAADRAWQQADRPDPRAEQAFGWGLAVAYARAVDRPLAVPVLVPQMCPFTAASLDD